MKGTVDVLVVGGGVAGAATAVALCRHNPLLSVLVVERSAYDNVRIGETLTPQVGQVLRQLGIWNQFRMQAFVPSASTSAAWGSTALHRNDFMLSAQGGGWHVDRTRFDRWLASEAEAAGATLWQQSRVASAEQCEDGWTVVVNRPKSPPQTIHARFIIDATGRTASFARQQGAQRVAKDDLVGVIVFFESDAPDKSVLVEAVPNGWWYSAGLPNNQFVVALMTDADVARAGRLRHLEAWASALDETTHTKRRVIAFRPKTQPKVRPAHSQLLNPICGDRWLAVGDAASTFDPLSSQGIFKALQTGCFAAYAASDALAGDSQAYQKYSHFITHMFESYWKTRGTYYSQEQRWPESPFWQRRHVS